MSKIGSNNKGKNYIRIGTGGNGVVRTIVRKRAFLGLYIEQRHSDIIGLDGNSGKNLNCPPTFPAISSA